MKTKTLREGHRTPDRKTRMWNRPRFRLLFVHSLILCGITHLALEASEGNKGDNLKRRIARFQLTNVPLGYAVSALNELGLPVCYEAPGDFHQEWYIDDAGVAVFAADDEYLVSMDLKDVKVRALMDELVRTVPDYKWMPVKGTHLINLMPKESELDFQIGPIDVKGEPFSILRTTPGLERLRPGVIDCLGLPEVSLDLRSGTARTLLNEIARQHAGLTWGYSGAASFNRRTSPWVEQVKLAYNNIHKGKPTDASYRYKMVERSVGGVLTLLVEKQPRVR